MKTSKHTMRFAALAAALLGLGAVTTTALSNGAEAGEQPNIFDIIRPGGDIGRAIDFGRSLAKIGESLNLKNDQRVQQSLGESVALSALARYPLSNDEKLNKYVTMVGLALSEQCEDPGIDFQFGLLDSEDANAFAAPHGMIFITRGAIRLMQDESELAGVLAHEMEHVIEKHGLQSVANTQFRKGALEAATAATGNPIMGQFGVLIDGVSEMVLDKGYDKDSEFEADKAAVTLAKAAGYDPAGLRRFLQRMEEKGHGKGAGQPFSTHPGHEARIERLEKIDGAGGETGLMRFIMSVN